MLSLTGVLWGLLALTILAIIGLGIKYRQKIWAQVKGKTPSVSKQTIIDLPFTMWRVIGGVLSLGTAIVVLPVAVVLLLLFGKWVWGVTFLGKPMLGNGTRASTVSGSIDRPARPVAFTELDRTELLQKFRPVLDNAQPIPSERVVDMTNRVGEGKPEVYSGVNTALLYAKDGADIEVEFPQCTGLREHRIWVHDQIIASHDPTPYQLIGHSAWYVWGKESKDDLLRPSSKTVILRVKEPGNRKYVRVAYTLQLEPGMDFPWSVLPDPRTHNWVLYIRFAYPMTHPDLAGHNLPKEYVEYRPGKAVITSQTREISIDLLTAENEIASAELMDRLAGESMLKLRTPTLPPEIFKPYPGLRPEVMTEVILRIELKAH